MRTPAWVDGRVILSCIILALVVIILYLIYQEKFHEVFNNYVWPHGLELVGFITGGLLAGLISAALYSWIYKPEKKIIDEIKNTEGKVINEFQELPKAFSTDIIMELFNYPPMTSSCLAKMFAKVASEWYERNYKRVLVEYAQDTYTLLGLDEVKKADINQKEDMAVWILDFKQEWKWINDSYETKRPFRDFSIILTTTDEAINLSDEFLDVKKPKGMELIQRNEFFDLTKKENIVRMQIVHKTTSTPLRSDAVDKMFEISEIVVTTSDGENSKLTIGNGIKEIKEGEEIGSVPIFL
jgi:hypothetical protein